MNERRPGRLAALAATLLAASATLVAAPDRSHAAGSTPALRLLDQTFVVPGVSSADAFKITIAGDALGPTCTTDADVIRVTAYRPVVTREEATAALEDPGDLVDDITFGLCDLARSPNGSIRLTVPTTIQPPADDTTEVLRLPSAGVIPVRVELRRAGDVDASFTTFIDRLQTGTDATTRVAERMQVAVAVLLDGGPTLQPDGSTRVGDADRAAVRRTLDLLEEIGEAPITVGVRPELVQGLSRSPVDQAALDELRAALVGVDVLSLPYVAMDPSAAATSGLQQEFVRQLTLGENVLAELLPTTLPSRLLWLFDHAVTPEGAEMLRGAGVRFGALLPPHGFSYAPPDRQFEIDYGDGTLPATRVDEAIGAALAEPGDDPTLTAYHLAAQVVLTRQMALDATQGRAPMVDHNMILATPGGHVGNLTTTAKLVELLASTPELALVSASSISSQSIPTQDGEPYREPPPAADVPSLDALGDELSATRTTTDAVASMLPPDDERPAQWAQMLDVAASGALGGAAREAYLTGVGHGIDEIRAAIVPPRSSRFTLGGRHSTIRLRLTNSGPVELTVRVIISSEKLAIEDADENFLVTLAPGETREEKVPVEARTNGEFPVDIRIVTPDNERVEVTEPIRVTARVNALTGLGQFATGAFVLVLLSWWVQHLRKRRRAAAAAATP